MKAVIVLLLVLTVPGCVRQEAEPVPALPSSVARQPTPVPHCQPPRYLVRDLTVPWSQRIYLVAACGGSAARVMR